MSLTEAAYAIPIAVHHGPPPQDAVALLALYAQGLCPMPEADGTITWCRYLPAAGADVRVLRVPRRLRKTVRRQPYRVTVDTAFDAVVAACADQPRAGGWITPTIQRIAGTLHRAGHGHAVEVWSDDTLVGGLYGIQAGSVFFGESMFTRAPEAGKIAFVHLAARMTQGGFTLLDTQLESAHLTRFGVKQRGLRDTDDYYAALKSAARLPAEFGPAGDDDPARVETFLTTVAGR